MALPLPLSLIHHFQSFDSVLSTSSQGHLQQAANSHHHHHATSNNSSLSLATRTTTTSTTTNSKQHAKVSPYVPNPSKQEQLLFAERSIERLRAARSPKLEKLTPFDVQLELSSAAAQGKLAYVSPTVRTLPHPQVAPKVLVNTTCGTMVTATGGGVQSSSSGLCSRASNMRLCVQPNGSSSMSQLSPVQLSQPMPQVLLNTAAQVDVHG